MANEGRIEFYEPEGIPLDNEEITCPECAGKHVVFGDHFMRKHLVEHHNWDDRRINLYMLYRDTPQVRAMVVHLRNQNIKRGTVKPVVERPHEEEVNKFLKTKQMNEVAQAIIKAGIVQESIEKVMESLKEVK